MSKYENIQDLPNTIRDVLPEDAQEIYREVYNEAWEEHAEEAEPGEQGRDSVAHRKAWAAMSQKYVKDEETGRWYPEGELPEKEEEEKGIVEELKDLV